MRGVVPEPESTRDPYRGIVLLLAAVGLLGGVGAGAAGVALGNPLLLDMALLLAVATTVLLGVALAQTARAAPSATQEAAGGEPLPPPPQTPAPEATPGADGVAEETKPVAARSWLATAPWRLAVAARVREIRMLDGLRHGAGIVGTFGALLLATIEFPGDRPAGLGIALAALAALIAAGLAAMVARYCGALDPAELPEAPGLARGASVVAWLLAIVAVATGLIGLGQTTAARALHFLVLAVMAAVCCEMALARRRPGGDQIFRLDLPVLSALGSRANVIAGVLDAAERQLGIDLRSTWALTVVRRSTEPLVIALALLGWLSTSLTVVHVGEEGLVERLGVPRAGQPLQPGLHLHAPWPVDRVFRLPVRQVQALTVGHEGEEAAGPENVLWAQEHAANEYTLLLGNGRDLITVDAAVQFRIRDARTWLYGCQNPADALRAIAYRVVMRSTVNRTLDQALAENVVALTGRMRAMVQQEADAMGLGVEVMAFTVGGMHPPVMVAAEYQAVASAELGKVTAAVSAQAYRNETVPAAEAEVVGRLNAARAEGAAALARAAGESWSFRTLEAQFRAAPKDYFFRRRLETLEKGLAGRRFVIVDSRIQRDGGELWLTP
jgi:regulator of protease activity HflC (stomatin/prohibitin superfamily)